MATTTKMQLSRAEVVQLRQLEDVLETARRWAAEEAKALVLIRDRRLYRAQYATFEEYAERRWQYDRTYLYRLCQWGTVLNNLSPIGDNLPTRESHARPLYGLSSDHQQAVWKLVTRTTAKPTAADVEHAVEKVLKTKVKPTGQRRTAPDGVVICADALGPSGVTTLADSSVDLFLFSPPYCEQRKGLYPSIPESEYPTWICRLMDAVRPKLASGGNVLLVAREHIRNGQISDVWLRARLALRSAGWIECETLIWNKPDAPPLGRIDRPRRSYEYIYWFARTPSPYVDMQACGSPPIERRARMRQYRNNPAHGTQPFAGFRSLERVRITDVVTAVVGGGIPAGLDHPAAMPLQLADQLVRTFSPPSGVVADPCCGSGTSLVAAAACGRRYWGCDLVAKYVELACRRVEAQAPVKVQH